MRIALRGVPRNQMATPDGIISVLIDKETGCPARARQHNATFEYFRDGHVPECEDIEDIPDVFNEPTDMDLTEESDEQQPETLF